MAAPPQLRALLVVVNALLRKRRYHAALAVLKGFRNGAINMYLPAGTLEDPSRLAVEKGYIPEPRWDPFPLLTAVVWGLVLWLFEYHRSTLQPSLQSSMTYLYEDSNVWHDISDFLIYNKSRPSN
uniref:Peroxisomal membrane protein 4 n=1 Tax=Nomascus leucogenys TaxID=61853 RepID=A0A2I3H852_NOMLE